MYFVHFIYGIVTMHSWYYLIICPNYFILLTICYQVQAIPMRQRPLTVLISILNFKLCFIGFMCFIQYFSLFICYFLFWYFLIICFQFLGSIRFLCFFNYLLSKNSIHLSTLLLIFVHIFITFVLII